MTSSGSGLFALAWAEVPFPFFLGRFTSWQAACGIVDGVLLGFSLAMASNCRTKECSVAAVGIVVLTDPRFVDDVALDDEEAVHCISGS